MNKFHLKKEKAKVSLTIGGNLGDVSLDLNKYDRSGFCCVKVTEDTIDFISVNEGQLWKFKEANKHHSFRKISTERVLQKCFLQNIKDGSTEKIQTKSSNVSFVSGTKPTSLINEHSALVGLCKQKLKGVSKGFFAYLRVVGVGFRVFFTQEVLTFKLGFSHFVKVNIPQDVKVFLPEPTLICVYGLDQNQVTQVAAKIREIKPPSAYKGKGIRFVGAHIALKAGKKKS